MGGNNKTNGKEASRQGSEVKVTLDLLHGKALILTFSGLTSLLFLLSDFKAFCFDLFGGSGGGRRRGRGEWLRKKLYC